jgi:antirestriction protein ArdC
MKNTEYKLVRDKIKELEEKIKTFKTSDEFLNFMKVMSRFHDYSFHNQILIMFQKNDATRVAGFRTWQKLGRHVKRGEKGIAILVPIPVMKDNDDGEEELKVFFKTGHVFDISQTDGKPVPEISFEVNNSKESLYFVCLEIAEKHNIKVEIVDDLKPYGTSMGGKVLLRKNDNLTSMAIVMLHELAHELMHHNEESKSLDKETKEFEAETVAYIVSSHFGIEPPSYKYLAAWQQKHQIIDSLKRISECSGRLIEEIEDGIG